MSFKLPSCIAAVQRVSSELTAQVASCETQMGREQFG